MIGVVDSGIGGFGITRALKALAPTVRIVYVADQKHFPYGDKSVDEIESHLLHAMKIAVDQGAKLIVVACNSASVSALERARKECDIPIVGTVPAIKPAAAVSLGRRIGVIGTHATITSEYQEQLIQEFGNGSKIYTASCPNLASVIERLEDPTKAIRLCTAPLLKKKIDTLVLACTHYPLIQEEIQDAVGLSVTLLNVNDAVARRVMIVVDNEHIPIDHGKDLFLTTGDVVHFTKQLEHYAIDRLASNGYTVEAVFEEN